MADGRFHLSCHAHFGHELLTAFPATWDHKQAGIMLAMEQLPLHGQAPLGGGAIKEHSFG